MKVAIVEHGPMKLVGLSIQVLLADVERKAPALVADFESRRDDIMGQILPGVDIIVSVDPPDYNDDTDNFKLFKGVMVDPLSAEQPEGLEWMELPAMTYACTSKPANDHAVFGSLYRWVHQSGHELADLYSIERVENGETTLMFPIRVGSVKI
ncbi:GyrI-like domain-containing protein [Paenibacillus kobensis]|uniref:GyrI-like domain-containing protein n=1 Tax=Paenibacillus kobensis TaxID=59841 RepID=UPI000FDA2788|nr:GyrI-like domain-containing protein [Paenibacillus kobensis]